MLLAASSSIVQIMIEIMRSDIIGLRGFDQLNLLKLVFDALYFKIFCFELGTKVPIRCL